MAREWAKGLVVTLLLAGLLFTFLDVEAWLSDTPRQETFDGLGRALFDKWVLPFEVLSLLLLGALMGALYLGIKVRRQGGPMP